MCHNYGGDRYETPTGFLKMWENKKKTHVRPLAHGVKRSRRRDWWEKTFLLGKNQNGKKTCRGADENEIGLWETKTQNG